jgi:hypothetical protein
LEICKTIIVFQKWYNHCSYYNSLFGVAGLTLFGSGDRSNKKNSKLYFAIAQNRVHENTLPRNQNWGS